MYSRIRYPETVPPAELDDYLEAGWRCAGQAIYTSHFMRFPQDGEGRIYSTLPTRLPLRGYSFGKRLRKLWRRVHRQFRVVSGQPFQFDREARRVHKRYAAAFPDRSLADEERYRRSPRGPFTFDTRSIRVYDGAKLVAFSLFNQGRRSLYSSQGIYDPAYARHSLGFFTMLAEVQYGIETGLQHYYPGYVVPGFKEFDYKLRLGDMEYFDLSSNSWQAYGPMQAEDVPINQMWKALGAIATSLKAAREPSALAEYDLFDIRFFEARPLPFLEYPLVLLAQSPRPAQYCPAAVFCPQTQRVNIFNVKFFGIGVHHLPTYQEMLLAQPDTIRFPMAVIEVLAEGLQPTAAAEYLKQKPYLKNNRLF